MLVSERIAAVNERQTVSIYDTIVTKQTVGFES